MRIRIRVAKRLYDLAVIAQYRTPRNLIFDMLLLPGWSGDLGIDIVAG